MVCLWGLWHPLTHFRNGFIGADGVLESKTSAVEQNKYLRQRDFESISLNNS